MFERAFESSFVANNLACLRNCLLTDVSVQVGTRSDRTFNSHRYTLYLSSDFFRQKLVEGQSLMIAQVEPEEFEAILSYIYQGRVILSTENVYKMMTAAHLLYLDDLERGCLSFISRYLLSSQ